jgi:hypothetical protein
MPTAIRTRDTKTNALQAPSITARRPTWSERWPPSQPATIAAAAPTRKATESSTCEAPRALIAQMPRNGQAVDPASVSKNPTRRSGRTAGVEVRGPDETRDSLHERRVDSGARLCERRGRRAHSS